MPRIGIIFHAERQQKLFPSKEVHVKCVFLALDWGMSFLSVCELISFTLTAKAVARDGSGIIEAEKMCHPGVNAHMEFNKPLLYRLSVFYCYSAGIR